MGSIIGIRKGTEEVPYKVLQKFDNGIEIREYGQRVVIETIMPSEKSSQSSAFQTLASYIFGKNVEHEHIAMTAPVEMYESNKEAKDKTLNNSLLENGEKMMRFTLPSKISYSQAPKPLSKKVQISEIGSQLIAAFQFSGSPSDKAFQEQSETLLEELGKTNYYPTTAKVATLIYDPPWTINCFRRNEVAVEVERECKDTKMTVQ